MSYYQTCGNSRFMTMPVRNIRNCIRVTCGFLVILFVYLTCHDTRNKRIPFSVMTEPKPSRHYLIEEDTKCAGGAPFLMLIIPSSPQDAFIRDALRRTWANESLVEGVSIKRLFLLGSPNNQSIQEEVKRESEAFHDIIQQDFVDSYRNLTLKTLMGLEWISRLCQNVSYVMKVDSDVFFNPWFLVRHILQPEKPVKVRFFTGLIQKEAKPIRNVGSKWYMPLSAYPETYYPTYCSGSGYVFSGELAGKIIACKEEIPLLPFEDVYVGMCLQSLGFDIFRPSGNWFIDNRIKYDRCQFAKVVTVHHFPPDELLKLWLDFTEAVKVCT